MCVRGVAVGVGVFVYLFIGMKVCLCHPQFESSYSGVCVGVGVY